MNLNFAFAWWQDTQFLHILHESLDFFNIPAEEQENYFLVDTKTSAYRSAIATLSHMDTVAIWKFPQTIKLDLGRERIWRRKRNE